MGTFRELKEFERNFDAMNVAELEDWKSYWTRHAQQLAPKVRCSTSLPLEGKRTGNFEAIKQPLTL